MNINQTSGHQPTLFTFFTNAKYHTQLEDGCKAETIVTVKWGRNSIYEDVSEDDSEEGIEKAVSEGHEDKSDHSTEIWAPRPMNSKEDSEDYF